MSDSYSDENLRAYNELHSTLLEVLDSFEKWSRSINPTRPAGRVASAVTEFLTHFINFNATPLIERLAIETSDFTLHLSEMIRGSARDLNLRQHRNLDSMGEVIDWLEKLIYREITPALDAIGIRDAQLEDLVGQARRDLTELRYILSKEQRQERLDRETVRSLKKLDSLGISPEDITSIRARMDDQSRSFSSWNMQADTLMEELQQTKESLQEFEARARRAEERYSAAQTRLDAVSKLSSANKLVQHFQTFRKKHDVSTVFFFALGLVTLFGVADFSVSFAMRPEFAKVECAGLSWRFALAAGGGAIGTYLLRLATYHRRLAVWADTMQVQLQTFASYTEQIGDEDSKNELRSEFAKRVFGDEPGRPSNGGDDSSETITASDLSSIIANLAKIQSKE